MPRRSEGTVTKPKNAKKSTHGEGGVSRDRDRWRAQYRHRGRLHRKGGFATEAAARRWLRHQITAIDRGEHTSPADSRSTVNDAIDVFLIEAQRREYKTMASLLSHADHLRRLMGTERLADLEAATLDDYYADQQGPDGRRIATQVAKQLTEPLPHDLSSIDLVSYRELDRRWQDWGAVRDRCQRVAVRVLDLLVEDSP